MYCGDGINDLVALASADVGMAVGSSHASAAASVSDRHSSVAGKPSYSCTACIIPQQALQHVRHACIVSKQGRHLNEAEEGVPESRRRKQDTLRACASLTLMHLRAGELHEWEMVSSLQALMQLVIATVQCCDFVVFLLTFQI